MRTLLTLMVVGILILAAGTAMAENFRQETDQMATYQTQNPLLEGQGHATLTLSPMFLEIHAINEATVKTEQDLLTRLAASQDELEVQRLVHRLERLDTERQLRVLKVRLKFARLEGRYDLAFSLRQEILQLLQRETDSVM